MTKENLNTEKTICMEPFTCAEIDRYGNLRFCCANYTKNSIIGNIFEQNFEDVWNGIVAQKFREKILNGDYSNCNLDVCQNEKKIVTSNLKNLSDFPKKFIIGSDRTCNHKCITCRDEIIKENLVPVDKIEEHIEKYYIPIFQNAEEIIINTIGECFVSEYDRKLIKKVSETYPNIKFNIMTNGSLFNETNLKQIGLYGKIKEVQISLHATTEKTYKKITRVGNFETVMKNLEYAAEEKRKGIIPKVTINFVVHSLNYKEMPDFVQLAEKYDIMAYFWEFQQWEGSEMLRNYEEYTVFEPSHTKFKDFVEVLKNPIFDSKHCYLIPMFQKYRKMQT